MGHNPAMIEEPSADPETSMSGGKRLQARVLRAQSRAQELYERVPVQVRRNARRLFSALFLVVVGTVLYRQLEGTDWAEVWSSLPASPWYYLLVIARFFVQPTVEAI